MTGKERTNQRPAFFFGTSSPVVLCLLRRLVLRRFVQLQLNVVLARFDLRGQAAAIQVGVLGRQLRLGWRLVRVRFGRGHENGLECTGRGTAAAGIAC